jgi:hypothetical protein
MRSRYTRNFLVLLASILTLLTTALATVEANTASRRVLQGRGRIEQTSASRPMNWLTKRSATSF